MSDDRSRVVVRMPAVGDLVTEGVVRFLRRVGEAVRRDEPVAELELDKVVVELVAPEAGVLESFVVDDSAVVRVDDPLYVLRTAAAGPLPAFASATLRWDAGHVTARAREVAEPPVAEAALILTALARALAAVPGLLQREREVATTWIEVDGEAVRRVCLSLPIDVEVAGALALARVSVGAEPPGWRAQLRVVRLLRGAASTGRLPGSSLQVVIGPVRDEAVVLAGAVVARPTAAISVASDVGEDALLRFVAVLAEQLERV